MATPSEVVNAMMATDSFSQWMGLVIDEVREGYCRLHCQLRPDMVNGFGIMHGGVAFSIADSAFAFACNSRNELSVAQDMSVTFTKAGKVGDVLHAEAIEIHNGRKTGLYEIKVTNQEGALVAAVKATAFRTGKPMVTDTTQQN